MPGKVVFLNGTSSSGKTTLGRALQSRLPGTWLLIGVDTFLQLLPGSFFERDAGMRFRKDGSITRGEEFFALYGLFQRAVRLLIDAGTDVIVDEVLIGGGADQAMWASSLSGLDVQWVGVRCDTDEVVRREAIRDDRLRNLALWQVSRVHAGVPVPDRHWCKGKPLFPPRAASGDGESGPRAVPRGDRPTYCW